MDIVLDSYALISFFLNEPGSVIVKEVLLEATLGKSKLYISSYNLGEMYYMLWRKASRAHADFCWEAILDLNIEVVVPTLNITFIASTLKATNRLSYADAHAAALSLHLNATLLTGDPEFNNLKSIKGFKVRFID